MSAARRLTFTETEIRSNLPSGWGISGSAAGKWDAAKGVWSIELYDGADNRWTVGVAAKDAGSDRLGALAQQIRKLELKALGRKSIISG